MNEAAQTRLLNRIPEFLALLRKLQRPRAHSSGTNRHRSPEDRADEELYGDLAALVELLGDLARRVESLEEDRVVIKSKFEVTRAAEKNWQPTIAIRTGVVFTNAVGEAVTLPRDFLDVLAANRVLDASDVDREGDEAVFRDGDRVVAKMPVSLLVVLDKVVASCPWISRSG